MTQPRSPRTGKVNPGNRFGSRAPEHGPEQVVERLLADGSALKVHARGRAVLDIPEDCRLVVLHLIRGWHRKNGRFTAETPRAQRKTQEGHDR